MEAARRWARALLRGSVPVGAGLLLWVAVGAGEERRHETLKALPEVSPELLAQRRRHNELVMAALREAAQTDDNVARRPVPWRK
ncbi:PREDICTED: ubiquinol-cytochrome-c reductase complex assembly factor 3-like [Calidris pugnax]|uniref:ubiquinol-cytochrome-c reductase complex assembly factor 3-like n=1 Tax=Calidris pugnax TaxID=198806 RepID=UPI00071D170E|nr:PREDICTED: ubiquinol-cytochrome-c reductase complex assembly factor 3-like [Calidris pugnax]